MQGKLFKVVNQFMYWHKGQSYGIVEIEDMEDRLTHYLARDPHINNAADCVPGLDSRGMGHLGSTLEEALQKIDLENSNEIPEPPTQSFFNRFKIPPLKYGPV
jgi:hypothetical protein